MEYLDGLQGKESGIKMAVKSSLIKVTTVLLDLLGNMEFLTMVILIPGLMMTLLVE